MGSMILKSHCNFVLFWVSFLCLKINDVSMFFSVLFQVPLVSRLDKAGLGCTSTDLPPDDPATERKKSVWRQAQKRYQDIS